MQIRPPQIVSEQTSRDGTVKWLVRVDSVAFAPAEEESGLISIGVTMETVIFTTAPPPPDFNAPPVDTGTEG